MLFGPVKYQRNPDVACATWRITSNGNHLLDQTTLLLLILRGKIVMLLA
jgi:hypothetical protein